VIKSRLDISDAALSIFLQDVGTFYDNARGLRVFGPDVDQTIEVLMYFSYQCCYCTTPVRAETVSWDHLVPVDKRALGLHAWGNVVPCCQICSSKRQQKFWKEFLQLRCATSSFEARVALIESFAALKRYDLDLNLHHFADTLYEDIGAITTTLIQLRYKQAEQKLRSVLAGEPSKRRASDGHRNSEVKADRD
jgi:hypothetical protein